RNWSPRGAPGNANRRRRRNRRRRAGTKRGYSSRSIGPAAFGQQFVLPAGSRHTAFDGSFGLGQVAFADRHSVEGIDAAALVERLGLGAKVVFDVFPVVPALIIGAERAAGVVSAVHHAILATRVAGNAVHNAVT